MTQLANIINRLLTDRDMTAQELSDKAGIGATWLSKIRSGRLTYVSQEHLAAIALALGRNHSEKIKIIAAHLRDESCGFAPDMIEIRARGDGTAIGVELDPDLEYLRQHMNDANVRQAVKVLAAMHRKSGNKNGNNGTAVHKPKQPRRIPRR